MSYTHLTTTERVKIETDRATALDRLAGNQAEPRLCG